MPDAGDTPADLGDLDALRSGALAWLAPSIAHELANPLGAIVAFAGFLATDPRLPPDLRDDARMLRAEADRTHRLVRTLLEVVRDRPAVVAPVVVDDLLDEVLELAASITTEASVERVITEGLPPVESDPSRLRQLLVALVVDALRGLGDRPRGGTLRVEASALRADVVNVEVAWRRADGTDAPNVEAIAAGDRAVAGIDATLSVSRDAAGGRIGLALPVSDAAAPEGASDPPTEAHRVRTATVLVCDDEDSIRALLARILERDGLRVVDAVDGPGALAIIEATEVDAVLTDHRMAGMSGIDLYAAAVDARPALEGRFVVMSGEPGAEDLVRFAHETGVTILAKPFDVQVVAATVRELVRNGTAA